MKGDTGEPGGQGTSMEESGQAHLRRGEGFQIRSPALTVWRCLVNKEQPVQSVFVRVAAEEGCGTGCSPREARWSRRLASMSRLIAHLIWEVGEGCDSVPAQPEWD